MGRRKACSWFLPQQARRGQANPHESVCPWESAGFSPTIMLRFRQFCKLVGNTQERLSPQACAAKAPVFRAYGRATEKRLSGQRAAISSSDLSACHAEGSVVRQSGHSPRRQHGIWWQAVCGPTPAGPRALLGPRVCVGIFLGPSRWPLHNFPTAEGGDGKRAATRGAVSVTVWQRC